MMRTTDDEIRIADADFPKPFRNGLEFNAPVHGTWNIVHIGLQMPEAIQIYVCARNCMRGVILTAAEMKESERFSFVILDEKDMVRENIDRATIEGVADVIEKRTRAGVRPRAIQLFTVCVHHFLGTDYKQLYRSLEERFPDIDFYRCYMDPIMQKKGYTPDQKLRYAMYEKLPQCSPNRRVISLLGSDFALDESSDLVSHIRERGFELRQARCCKSYEEFLRLSEANLFIAVYPAARYGVEAAARRLGREFLYLPGSFDGELIDLQLKQLEDYMSRFGALTEADHRKEKEEENADILLAGQRLKQKLGDIPLCLDATVHPRVLGLARLLTEMGMRVEKIYLDAMNGDEAGDYEWLRLHTPDLILSASIHVKKRRYVTRLYRQKAFEDPDATEKAPLRKIAVGQKAAYFEQTPYFVNMVNGFGLYGRDGIVRMLEAISDAADSAKDIEDIVPRKGLGCESCL